MAAARTLPSHERAGVLETYRSRGRRTATCRCCLENLAPAHQHHRPLMMDASFSRLKHRQRVGSLEVNLLDQCNRVHLTNLLLNI
jgi:hypothetical protein